MKYQKALHRNKIYILCHVWHVNRSILRPKTVKGIIIASNNVANTNNNRMIFITSTCSKLLDIKSIMRARVYCLFLVFEKFMNVFVCCVLNYQTFNKNKNAVTIHYKIQLLYLTSLKQNSILQMKSLRRKIYLIQLDTVILMVVKYHLPGLR